MPKKLDIVVELIDQSKSYYDGQIKKAELTLKTLLDKKKRGNNVFRRYSQANQKKA